MGAIYDDSILERRPQLPRLIDLLDEIYPDRKIYLIGNEQQRDGEQSKPAMARLLGQFDAPFDFITDASALCADKTGSYIYMDYELKSMGGKPVVYQIQQPFQHAVIVINRPDWTYADEIESSYRIPQTMIAPQLGTVPLWLSALGHEIGHLHISAQSGGTVFYARNAEAYCDRFSYQLMHALSEPQHGQALKAFRLVSNVFNAGAASYAVYMNHPRLLEETVRLGDPLQGDATQAFADLSNALIIESVKRFEAAGGRETVYRDMLLALPWVAHRNQFEHIQTPHLASEVVKAADLLFAPLYDKVLPAQFTQNGPKSASSLAAF
jgi:hypothetical protein